MVTETPEIYRQYVQPYMQRKREAGRLSWVYNILDGKTEQEDVIVRQDGDEEGFLVLPDLNWDRKTIGTLRLLALVERRDIWSLRDLRKGHVEWLKHMREKILDAVVKVYDELDRDQLKLYVHCMLSYSNCYLALAMLTVDPDQPTYYHFHIHIVNVMLEAGTTQSTGKAFGLENIISQLETMGGGPDAGMADASLTYFMGEAGELWTEIFGPLKRGETPKLPA